MTLESQMHGEDSIVLRKWSYKRLFLWRELCLHSSPLLQERGGALFPQVKRKELQCDPWRVGFGVLTITGHRALTGSNSCLGNLND